MSKPVFQQPNIPKRPANPGMKKSGPQPAAQAKPAPAPSAPATRAMKKPVREMRIRENSPASQRWLRWTLLLLVVDLTFEGMLRKLNIGGSNFLIFVLKDVIIAVLGVQVLRMKRPRELDFLWVAYLAALVAFLPCILQTAAHDPILAVFGAKEYLLYPIVGFAVFLGFEKRSVLEITRYFRWLALLVIPTAAVALIQLRLPADHWLNMSVEGGSLEGFSAAGHLRVSSTFSFVAQYCAFIDAQVFIVMFALHSLKDVNWFKKLIYLSVVPLLIVSSYATGSRGAVLASIMIVCLAAVLCMLKFQSGSAMKVIFIIGGLLATLVAVKLIFPDAFVAYAEREQGQLIGVSAEMKDRIWDSMFGWINSVFTTPFLGYGLGIMSNGSQYLSSYAATTRAFSWTETDFATTLFEGGIYLVFVWYAFRYFVIYQVVKRFLALRSEVLSVPASFSVAFVIITGVADTLAIQPPIAIWWWISVGLSLLLWWKSVEPRKTEDTAATDKPAEPQQKSRGQSAYARQLHQRKK